MKTTKYEFDDFDLKSFCEQLAADAEFHLEYDGELNTRTLARSYQNTLEDLLKSFIIE